MMELPSQPTITFTVSQALQPMESVTTARYMRVESRVRKGWKQSLQLRLRVGDHVMEAARVTVGLSVITEPATPVISGPNSMLGKGWTSTVENKVSI